MSLSSEDSFRLNVLLNQRAEAIRIDESSMTVFALTEKGEAKVKLNPNCRDERYLKLVRETVSSHVLGSPGGYPVYLRRWTRMGQARDESLGQLLMLGEPEAVVAVVHAAGLTNDIARRAWWAMPTSENARRMLEREAVVHGGMGPVLAEFLYEYLPFETEPLAMVESVRLMLQPGVMSEEQRQALWSKAARKNTYYVGFLAALPDELPEEVAAHPLYSDAEVELTRLQQPGNGYARQLKRVLAPSGQAFVKTALRVFQKPNNQDVVVALLRAVHDYFAPVHEEASGSDALDNTDAIVANARAACELMGSSSAEVKAILDSLPQLRAQLVAVMALSNVSEQVVNPVFSRSDAIGTVMRRKLEPVFTPILEQFAALHSS
ncbi:MAG: sulfur reduction protein DsrS [Pseudomonadota bacterium]|nr:MAG: sulfur reduction protein DsrS [Pseudomonadota bacterium]